MRDRWSELARQARMARRTTADEAMPFGFADAVLRRLSLAGRANPFEAWAPMLRPALGLAFATALLCVLLQTKSTREQPENLLVATENMIQLAVLK